MPLSENEQRQLDAIERALYADDPKFVQHVRFTDPRSHARRRILGGAVCVGVGVGVLLGGVISGFWYIGIAGFVVMLIGATRAYSGVRRLAGGAPARPPKAGFDLRARGPHAATDKPKPGRPRGVGFGGGGAKRRGRPPRPQGAPPRFVEYFEERWRRRGEGY